MNDITPGFCKDCQFSTLTRPNPSLLQDVRVCLRHPPQVVPVPTTAGLHMQTVFPMVGEQMGCFEFQPEPQEQTLS